MKDNCHVWSEKYGWCQDKFGVNWQAMTFEMGGQKIGTLRKMLDARKR
ncbi:MAG: VOC family protein [Acidobacteriota bacterium]|nr:VOC family protein [Acidobacteriota bacterium]MDH3528531.1 VOC family protein [Acidobacteriota bacterium]